MKGVREKKQVYWLIITIIKKKKNNNYQRNMYCAITCLFSHNPNRNTKR